MASKKEKIIFLDFDGTICDASSVVDMGIRKVLNEIDYRVSRRDIAPHRGKKMPDVFLGLGVAKQKISILTKQLYNNLIRDVSARGLKLCCDVSPLRKLKSKGYKFIVISNNEAGFITKALKILGISNLFFEAYGSESFYSKDEMLTGLIRKYKLDPQKTYYVGDRFSDIILARKAKMLAVAIHNKYSVSTLSEIMSEKPDFLIADFKGLYDIVTRG